MGEVRIDSGWKADWRLVPKDEESTFKAYQCDSSERSQSSVPSEESYPPLLEYLMKQQMKIPLSETPMLKLNIKQGKWNNVTQ